MHGKKFSEKYRSKNGPKAANPKPPKPAVGRPRTKQLLGAPFEFVAEVCRLTRGRATAMVAQCIYRRTIVCDCLTVTLPSGELAKLGVNRQYKQKALIQLQRAGLIKVANAEGRTALVTLLWQEG